SDLNVRWSDWDPELSDNVIFANRRENSSGTRLSQYVGIQRFVPSKKFIFIEDDLPEDHVRRGTGAMLTAINGAASNFGYAFVSGTAGNNLPNIRVGGYLDSMGNLPYPYANASAKADLPLPNNNGQPGYGTEAYYDIRTPGSYPLWAYANSF